PARLRRPGRPETTAAAVPLADQHLRAVPARLDPRRSDPGRPVPGLGAGPDLAEPRWAAASVRGGTCDPAGGGRRRVLLLGGRAPGTEKVGNEPQRPDRKAVPGAAA